MTRLASIALICTTIVYNLEYVSGQTLCDVCQCDPEKSDPKAVQCVGLENLPSIPANISSLVVSLHVTNLEITRLNTSDLAGLSSLINLVISDNTALSIIEDGAFLDQSILPALNLRNNSISEVTEAALSGLVKLTEINIEKNKISSIPKKICTNLPLLETLLMSYNSLTSVASEDFHGCTNIIHIDLSNNEITSIAEDAFQNLTSLTRLELNGNQLTSFHSAWIANKSSSLKLTIDNTSFTCTQQLKEEFNKMIQSHPQIIGCDKAEKFCPSCQNFGGRLLANITTDELNPATTKYVTTSSDANPKETTSNSMDNATVAFVTGSSGSGTNTTNEAKCMHHSHWLIAIHVITMIVSLRVQIY